MNGCVEYGGSTYSLSCFLSCVSIKKKQVRFPLETATMETVEDVVREMREKLRLCPLSAGTGNPRGGVPGGLGIEDWTVEETEAP